MQLRHELPDLRPRFVSLCDLSAEIAARYTEDAPDFHANEAETSLMMQLEPDAVDVSAVADEPDRTVGRVLLYPMPESRQQASSERPAAPAPRAERNYSTSSSTPSPLCCAQRVRNTIPSSEVA